MSTIGLMGLLVAFAGVAVSVLCLLAGAILGRKGESSLGETLTWGGHIASILTTVALTVCCGILVYCFFAGDYSIEYVLKQHSNAEGTLGWLFKLSGLWAGREGSLLFWAWLISVFNSVVAIRDLKSPRKLDSMALMVSQLVLAAFVGVLLFSESNMPFTVTPQKYYNADGSLTNAASMLGMNSLLEHWAMAIHPPTLFVGYAGLTVPFAYAIAALIVNDPVSLVLFGALIVAALLAGVVGLVVRWKSFGPAADGSDEVENLLSKEGAYYFNNVIMVVSATLLAYLTVSSALPEFLPFGGQTVSSGTFNAIARPLGVVYLAILAVCPLLAWGKTLRSKFVKQARIPAICALVLFAVLAVYWATYLVPSYNAILAAGGTAAEELASDGPAWYYNGLALVGFFVASVLLFNSLFMLGRIVRSYKESHSCGAVAAFGGCLRNRPASFGGFLSHAAMAVILVGLIGSSMYVTEKVAYIGYDEATDTASETFQIKDYTLEYVSNSVTEVNNGDAIMYTVNYDAYKDGAFIGRVSPSVQLAQKTQQQKLVASVISLPTEDLFVVYRGVNNDGAFSMDVRVNPLISLVWAGFGLLMIGVCVATAGRRRASRKLTDEQRVAADEALDESAAGAA